MQELAAALQISILPPSLMSKRPDRFDICDVNQNLLAFTSLDVITRKGFGLDCKDSQQLVRFLCGVVRWKVSLNAKESEMFGGTATNT